MKAKARLALIYESKRETKTVVRAVSPDNAKVPTGVTVETVKNNCQLLAVIRCEKLLETFINTLDDLLACISVAEKAFEAVKRSAA
ncbi:MAG: KEOPS complex subunit Pcc1 [Candidatus Bathyarchaeia archaeon]